MRLVAVGVRDIVLVSLRRMSARIVQSRFTHTLCMHFHDSHIVASFVFIQRNSVRSSVARFGNACAPPFVYVVRALVDTLPRTVRAHHVTTIAK